MSAIAVLAISMTACLGSVSQDLQNTRDQVQQGVNDRVATVRDQVQWQINQRVNDGVSMIEWEIDAVRQQAVDQVNGYVDDQFVALESQINNAVNAELNQLKQSLQVGWSDASSPWDVGTTPLGGTSAGMSVDSCLQSKDIVLFGGAQCGYTHSQLQMLGDQSWYRTVLCDENLSLCQKMWVRATPTWFIEWVLYEWEQGYDAIAVAAGCR